MKQIKKILIIRFSSFGDIIQCLSVVLPLKKKYPDSQIHWVLRSDMQELVQLHPDVSRVFSFDRRDGMRGLFFLAKKIRQEKYDVIYDAHSNLRSRILCFFLRVLLFDFHFQLIRRSKKRWLRFLLFSLRFDYLKKDRKGAFTYLSPLGMDENNFFLDKIPWKFSPASLEKVRLALGEFYTDKKGFITLAPSAAWEMKRWPLDSFKELIRLLPERRFVICGGPKDDFCEELKLVAPERVINLAGKLSLMESCVLVKMSSVLVVADTGLLHVADIFGTSGIALMGPTAFGYPTGKSVIPLDRDYPCRPCTKDGRGQCSQKEYQKCLRDISPEEVALLIEKLLAN